MTRWLHRRHRQGRRPNRRNHPLQHLAACGAIGSVIVVLAMLLAISASAKGAPDWVERGGTSTAYQSGRYLTGFAQAEGKQDALESAKQLATADLARQISVQIESSVVDITKETNGQIENDLTSQIRATSDIRLEGVRFETYRKRKKVWVLAVLERLPAAIARRKQRDQALHSTKLCLGEAEKEERAGRPNRALDIYRGCRTPLDTALEHEAVAAALSRTGLLADEASEVLVRHAALINSRVRAIPHEDARSIRSAADGLATQLSRSGVGRGQQLTVAPFLYQSRDVSSPFGREIAIALESAIGRSNPSGSDPARTGKSEPRARSVVVRGTYHEAADRLQLRATAKEAGSGRLLASAEVDLTRQGIPKNLAIRPPNFDAYANAADKLSGGEVVSGDLRIELRTNKGIRGLVFDEGEDLQIYVRVNHPAWVRLIYVLTNGEHVPIEEAWYIDNSKVNQLVEYPAAFEIVAPFGVEMIHGMAHTEKPGMLVTHRTQIEGQDYQVISEGADQVVRQRGIARKQKKQVAEQMVQLTTMRATSD
jgi:hypothetical protein